MLILFVSIRTCIQNTKSLSITSQYRDAHFAPHLPFLLVLENKRDVHPYYEIKRSERKHARIFLFNFSII